MVDVGLRSFVVEEDARLVHVIPESGDAFVQIFLIERAEPLARLRVCEIRKRADAGPDFRIKLTAFGGLNEMAERLSVLIDAVVRVGLHARINDDDDAEA